MPSACCFGLCYSLSLVNVQNTIDLRREIIVGRGRSFGALETMWEVRGDSEARNESDLWVSRPSLVLWHERDDALFIQHTYLMLVAKTTATPVLGIEGPREFSLSQAC